MLGDFKVAFETLAASQAQKEKFNVHGEGRREKQEWVWGFCSPTYDKRLEDA